MSDLNTQPTFESLAAEASNAPVETTPAAQPAPSTQPAPQVFSQPAAQPQSAPTAQPQSNQPRYQAPAVPGTPQPGQQQPPAVSGQPAAFNVREYLRGQQFAVDHYPDDRSVLEALVGQARKAQQIPQIQQYADYGQRLWSHREQIEALLNGQQQPQQQPAPVSAPPVQPGANRLKPPENYQAQWEQFVQVDPQTGILKGITPDVPQSIINAVQQNRDYQRARLQEVITGWESPEELQTKMMAKVETMMQERLAAHEHNQRQQYEAQQHNQQINNIVKQQEGWIFQLDAQGNKLRDFAGNPMMTAEGTQYHQLVTALEARGLNDPVYADAIARFMLANSQEQAPAPNGQQPNGQPAPQVDQKQARQDRFLNRAPAQHSPNTVRQALDPTVPPKNPRGTFLHESLSLLKERGGEVPQQELAAASSGFMN